MRLRLVDLRRERGWTPPADWLEGMQALAAPAGRPDWEAALVLVDDERMAALNRDWRARDEATDVLSFSSLEPAGAGSPDLPGGEGFAARDLWRSALEAVARAEVGEIVLAPGFIAGRCRANGWPLQAELAWLTAHGLLHLLGWEHDDPAQERAMRAREARLLAAVGLEHPLQEGRDAE